MSHRKPKGISRAVMIGALIITGFVHYGCATSPAEPSDTVDEQKHLVVPFQSVGVITGESTRAHLADEFDESRLLDIETTVGEGFVRDATVVDTETDRELEVVWPEDEVPTAEEVRIRGEALTTPEGIGLGTTLDELADILGEFEAIGFEVTGGGQVLLQDTQLAEYHGGLQLYLRATNTDWEHYENVIGYEPFSSSDPNLRASEPVVSEMILIFESPDSHAR